MSFFNQVAEYNRNFIIGLSMGGTLAELYVSKDLVPENSMPRFMGKRRTWGMEEFYDAACAEEHERFVHAPGLKDGVWRGFMFFVLAFRRFKATNFLELAQKMNEHIEREERGF